MYDAEVVPSTLSPEEAKYVLGGQVCMWGETMAAPNLAVRAWQIGVAAAENFWGKNVGVSEVNTWATQDRFNR